LSSGIRSRPNPIASTAGHCDLGLFVKRDRAGGVKGDRIPHDLCLLRRDTALLHKRARCIGAVDLEPFLRRVPVGQTEIMQNRGNGEELGVRQRFGVF
jgi:hypothetical protein